MARPKSNRRWAKVIAGFCGLLSAMVLSWEAAGWAQSDSAPIIKNDGAPIAKNDSAPITIAGTRLSDAQLRAAVATCRRDAPDLELRSCLDEFIVPLYRLDREVSRRHLTDTPQGRRRTAGVLAAALYAAIAADIAIQEAELKAYVEQHQRDFSRPLRLRLFRILVDTEEEATRVLAQLGPDTTLAQFRALCRSHSKDPATLERGGDLGFVWPDGTTEVPQLRAEASLYEAALAVPDGAFIRKPVPERKQFGVVWRRGSLGAVNLPTTEAERVARERLLEQHTHEALDSLVASARTTVRPEPLGLLQREDCKIFAR